MKRMFVSALHVGHALEQKIDLIGADFGCQLRIAQVRDVVPGGDSISAANRDIVFHNPVAIADRINDIARIEIRSQAALMGIMYKTGPLHNPADRDHCVQYIVAVGLIHGELKPQDFEDDFAAADALALAG